MASVRFICGTQEIHRTLERRLAEFLGTEDAVLFGSCFDANGGVFEALLDERDAMISDALNHASIIDGVRLCKAQRLRYANRDMAELEARLVEAKDARYRLIVTDGVFSMDGYLAPLDEICALADATTPSSWSTTPTPSVSSARPDAAPPSSSACATGSTSSPGRSARRSAAPRAATSPRRRRSSSCSSSAPGPTSSPTPSRRPSSPPRSRCSTSSRPRPTCGSGSTQRRPVPRRDDRRRVRPAAREHPIVPVMFGDAISPAGSPRSCFARGVYAVAFSFPVVPQGQARIRVQLSAAHTDDDVDRAVAAFVEARSAS